MVGRKEPMIAKHRQQEVKEKKEKKVFGVGLSTRGWTGFPVSGEGGGEGRSVCMYHYLWIVTSTEVGSSWGWAMRINEFSAPRDRDMRNWKVEIGQAHRIIADTSRRRFLTGNIAFYPWQTVMMRLMMTFSYPCLHINCLNPFGGIYQVVGRDVRDVQRWDIPRVRGLTGRVWKRTVLHYLFHGQQYYLT